MTVRRTDSDGQVAPTRIPEVGLLTLLAVAEFMLTLDLSIVNVALPSIRGDVGSSQSSLQWVVNAYALTFAGFLLLGGRAADLFGGRRVFLGSLSAFTVASLACGLATGETMLVASRAIQGLCAGVLAPATLSILTAVYREPQARTRALAIWTAVAIGGGAVGGLLGGLLTATLSWRWIFFVNVPVGTALLALAIRRLPRADGEVNRELDLAGAMTVTGGLTALVWGLIRSNETGWGSAEVVGAFALAALLLGAFVLIETLVARAPLVPFSVFRSRLVSAGNLLSFLSFVPVMATWFFLSLYVQGIRGYSPAEAGLLFLPVSLAVVGGSQLSFRAISRLDARALFLSGGLVAAVGLVWLGGLHADTKLVWVIAPASLAMLGGGLMFAPITMAATSVAPQQGGLASGLLNTSRQIGGALGLAVLGAIAAAHTPGGADSSPADVSSSYGTALTVGAVVFVVTAVVGAGILPARLTAPPAQRESQAVSSPAPNGNGGSIRSPRSPEKGMA
jgi:EmrB/QacA subfamily drug resistance transporter